MRNPKESKLNETQNSIPSTNPTSQEVHPTNNPMEVASAPQMPTRLVFNSYESTRNKKSKPS